MKKHTALIASLTALLATACARPQPYMQPQGVGFQAPGYQQFSQNLQTFGSNRRDVNPLIQNFHRDLVQRNPEMVQLKYQAMSESPFAFYRATAFLFYNDVKAEQNLAGGINVPLQGDFHLENMGTYRVSNGSFAYDLNDFDEAVTGPHTWDLARLAVSIHLAADEVGIKKSDRQELIQYFLQRYVVHLQSLQRQPNLLNAPLDERYLSGKAAEQVTQARQRFDRTEWLNEMTRGGRFVLDEKVLPLQAPEIPVVEQALSRYAQSRREGAAFFQLKDAATRIAGKGSLGRYRYIVLIEGPTRSGQDDLILEIKEAITPSASLAGVGRSNNDALRIVQAYQRFLPGADPYLGLTSIGQLPAYVRELLPKETVNLTKVNKVSEYSPFLDSVALIIARAHARGGQTAQLTQATPDLAANIGSFADRYADQVVSDFKSFHSN